MTASLDPIPVPSASILIRIATAEDSQCLWEWRNDELTRKMSVNSERVDREAHETWYQGLLASLDRHLYIGLLDGVERVGVCRFDMGSGNGRAEVSINLNPACRGRRLSAALLGAAMTRFRQEQGVNLSARIKPSNIASIRCFTANGFVLVGGDADMAHYRYDYQPYTYRPSASRPQTWAGWHAKC